MARSKILIIGRGYVGDKCAQAWPDAVVSEEWIETPADTARILEKHKPGAVLNAAGIVGKPNVDWCDAHQWETIAGNTVLPLNIAKACQDAGVYLLHIGSGCIYYGESPSPGGWLESDFANPEPTYTRAKYAADLTLSTMPNIGIARIRMPLDSRPSPKNIIDKLVSYPRIIDVENSLTVLDDMVEVFRALLDKKAEGIFHVTNPGSVRHKEIIELYREYVDPDLPEKEWLDEEELVAKGLVKKKRSSNILQSKNLEKYGIKMKPAPEAVREAMKKYAQAKKNSK